MRLRTGAGEPTPATSRRPTAANRTRQHLTALAALLTFVLGGFTAAITAPAASAGEITTWACRTPTGAPAPLDRIDSVISTSGMSVVNGCGSGDALRLSTTGGSKPAHAHLKLWFAAPANTSVRSIELWRVVDMRTWGSWTLFSGPTPVYDAAHVREGCASAGGCNGLPWANSVYPMGGADGWSIVTEACTYDFGCSDAGPTNAAINAVGTTLVDNEPPAYSSRGGTLMNAGVKKGNVTLTAQLTDAGVGLRRLRAIVDGRTWKEEVLSTSGGRCVPVWTETDYVYGQPCPLSHAMSATLDTTSLTDGRHAVKIFISDAALNQTVIYDDEIETDNFWEPSATSAPTIDAPSARVGATFTSTTGSWSASPAPTYARQWFRCPAAVTAGTGIADCDAIAGADRESYVASADDAYRRLILRVRATNTVGSTVAYSAVSRIVVDEEGIADPTPDVTVAVGWASESNASAPRPAEVLTIDPGKWVGKRLTYTYRFKRCATSGSCTTLAEGALKTYSVSASDVGATIIGEVTASNAFGSRTAQTTATGTVLPVERDAGGPTQKPPGDGPPPVVLPDIVPPNTGGGTQVVGIPNGSCEGGQARLRARFANKKTTATVAYGRGSKLTVTLICVRTGKPIAGAELAIATTTAVGKKAAARVARTDAKGATTLKLPKGVSRSIAFGWRADSLAKSYSAQATARLLVRSKITMRASSTRVQPGGTVTLSGSVAGAPKGIVLNVQARDGKRWRTFDQVKTGNRGTYKYAYRFKRSPAGAAFSFRVETAPNQKKLATQTAASKHQVVRIA